MTNKTTYWPDPKEIDKHLIESQKLKRNINRLFYLVLVSLGLLVVGMLAIVYYLNNHK